MYLLLPNKDNIMLCTLIMFIIGVCLHACCVIVYIWSGTKYVHVCKTIYNKAVPEKQFEYL